MTTFDVSVVAHKLYTDLQRNFTPDIMVTLKKMGDTYYYQLNDEIVMLKLKDEKFYLTHRQDGYVGENNNFVDGYVDELIVVENNREKIKLDDLTRNMMKKIKCIKSLDLE